MAFTSKLSNTVAAPPGKPKDIQASQTASSQSREVECLTLDREANYGLAGQIVEAIEPHTEADPVALLVHLLAEFSAIIGTTPHLQIGSYRSPLCFWAVLVGETAKARKGTAEKCIKPIIQKAAPLWTRGELKGNLSSGEGLVWAVRDADQAAKDPGVSDKRLFLVETEFGNALAIMGREGNSLSGVVRDAWDGESLAPMTKHVRIRATSPYIVIVGHVTKEELLQKLKITEAVNGFANRFTWFFVQRSKVLPFPQDPPEANLTPLIHRLRKAITFSQNLKESIGFTKKAKILWEKVYPGLSEGMPGVVGSVLNRAEAQVRRVAALYALLDSKKDVHTHHLKAALALWEYSEASVRWIFGNATGDPLGDKILKAIHTAADGVTDTDIYKLCGKNIPAKQLEQAKNALVEKKYIYGEKVRTKGRTRTIWKPGPKRRAE